MNIENEVVHLLKEKGLILATAESCTGGLVAKRITDVSGSSEVFQCGIVSYANRIKHNILGVDENALEKYGAVSAPVAAQMAKGAVVKSENDLAVAITGIAGPNSDNTSKPVGLVFIAVCDKNMILTVKEFRFPKADDNIREINRNHSADEALKMVKEYLAAYPEVSGTAYDTFIKDYI